MPVIDGHTMAVWVDIKEPVETLEKAFRDYKPPIKGLPTQPKESIHFFEEEPDRPQPRLDRMRGKGMTVSVGRLREGVRFHCNGAQYHPWCCRRKCAECRTYREKEVSLERLPMQQLKENTVFVGNKPVMNYVLAVVTQFNNGAEK